MRRDQLNNAMKGGHERESGYGVMPAVLESASSGNVHSLEFFDLISEWDAEAINDDYYVTSSDFLELQSKMKRNLLRGVLVWAAVLCVVMTVLTLIYSQ